MSASQPLVQVLQDIRNSLSYLKQSGCTGFDCTPRGLETLATLGRAQPQPVRGGEDRKKRAVPDTLEGIRSDLGECTRCNLSRSRTHIVFGQGSADARLVFVGEGPGFEEDQCGQPFVGAAGQLLTKIITAMGLTREAVYICNVVKCRPPENRNPAPDEIQCCLPFLHRQLAAIRPAVVCALGKVAAQTLLATDTPISRLRGRFHTVTGMEVMPTFHPAYLLRNPERKREVWEDVQRIMKRLA